MDERFLSAAVAANDAANGAANAAANAAANTAANAAAKPLLLLPLLSNWAEFKIQTQRSRHWNALMKFHETQLQLKCAKRA